MKGLLQAHIPVNATIQNDDTIAAIATPPGPGGIGIIRISGPRALPVLKGLFKPGSTAAAPPRFTSHRMHYGWIIDPQNGRTIDEVLAVYMRAPHSYTTEDLVEIQCHGSYLVLEDILGLVLAAGVRRAQPGEFTKRAFLNGRIDLTRAEAVLELVQARTQAGLDLALAQLQGRLHERVAAVRDSLLAILAVIEVAIDFPDDDVEILDPDDLTRRLRLEIQEPVGEMIATADQGKIFRDGISVVILGRPNVGKSSLLNTLLKEERALVTPVPGTTRDTIEEYINIKGMPVRIVDTAGLRETKETVEEMGIQRARAKMAEADLILFMLDASAPLTGEDCKLYSSITEKINKKKVLLVLNKKDIAPAQADHNVYAEAFPGEVMVSISAKTLDGIAELEDTIFRLMTNSSFAWDPGLTGAPNLRHKASLQKALDATRRLADGLAARELSPDLLAIELQSALDHLGDIVGETTAEDVLDAIFERFCIGK